MSKRKYTHTQELLPEIQVMIANGKSHLEIEEFLGLTGDRPVHNLLDSVYTGYARIAAQMAIQRTCTAAIKASEVLA